MTEKKDYRSRLHALKVGDAVDPKIELSILVEMMRVNKEMIREYQHENDKIAERIRKIKEKMAWSND